MQESLKKDIINEFNKGCTSNQIANNLGVNIRMVNKVIGYNQDGSLQIRTNQDLNGVQPAEVEAFKHSLKIGQEFLYRPIDGERKGKLIHVIIKEIYPNFVYTEDNKSLLFFELMITSGWLNDYRRKRLMT